MLSACCEIKCLDTSVHMLKSMQGFGEPQSRHLLAHEKNSLYASRSNLLGVLHSPVLKTLADSSAAALPVSCPCQARVILHFISECAASQSRRFPHEAFPSSTEFPDLHRS